MLAIYVKLVKYPSVGLPVDVLVPATPISLYSGKKLVAHGTIAVQTPSFDTSTEPSVSGSSSRCINVTPTRAIIDVEQVFVPESIVSLHQKTLSQLSTSSSPFQIVVSRKSLRTRGPIVTDPMMAPESLNSISNFIVEDHLNFDPSDSS
ncbi:hypothetical protein C8J56DRAFT_1170692 [Mycena floridula]|nr:hypothetical protein C8J56DRAFT_1170692 [Mycena floridula]